ncbi:MAG: rhodanese-like domain-containing protein [Endozoicomonadaceae bacterium]|nr:rhodanese-like domain-containing protein [Endozoicomonadaceae bacterium]
MEQFIEFAINHPALVGLFAALVVLLIFFEMRKGGQGVTTQELTQLLNRENGLVLDVRAKKEFGKGHIVNAINLPFAEMKERLSELDQHRERPMVVVDAMGQHAGTVNKQLQDAGFINVKRLKGGLNSWRGENLPLVTV